MHRIHVLAHRLVSFHVPALDASYTITTEPVGLLLAGLILLTGRGH